MNKPLFAATTALMLHAAAVHAQEPPAPYQLVNCIKIQPGKFAEFRSFVQDGWLKVQQARANEGRFISSSLLRSVLPAGEEARCDYMITTLYENVPPEPVGAAALEADLKKAGIPMTADEYVARRNATSKLISTEIWRPRVRVGQPAKGNYLFINYMKVHNSAEYNKFEREVWRPLAEQYIKDGAMSAWVFSTAMLPGGTDLKYAALSADIFPNYAAAFKASTFQATFAKVHPGKNADETMAGLSKLRSLAQRHFYVISERITKSNLVSKTQ